MFSFILVILVQLNQLHYTYSYSRVIEIMAILCLFCIVDRYRLILSPRSIRTLDKISSCVLVSSDTAVNEESRANLPNRHSSLC